jgi:hypothetical protein
LDRYFLVDVLRENLPKYIYCLSTLSLKKNANGCDTDNCLFYLEIRGMKTIKVSDKIKKEPTKQSRQRHNIHNFYE